MNNQPLNSPTLVQNFRIYLKEDSVLFYSDVTRLDFLGKANDPGASTVEDSLRQNSPNDSTLIIPGDTLLADDPVEIWDSENSLVLERDTTTGGRSSGGGPGST